MSVVADNQNSSYVEFESKEWCKKFVIFDQGITFERMRNLLKEVDADYGIKYGKKQDELTFVQILDEDSSYCRDYEFSEIAFRQWLKIG